MRKVQEIVVVIPVYEPYLGPEEKELVLDCIQSSWISSSGRYVKEFEDRFAQRSGSRHGISVTNGTAALHLALYALGIGPGDEVLVPSLTFVATANAVSYTGATPIFVDSERDTWNISPEDAERHTTKRTRAIIPVHLYGHPAKMAEIRDLSRVHGLNIVEDCAQAHFAKVGVQYVGTFGIAGTFSFYGNKLITTGEGGMVITDDDQLAERLRFLKNHGMSPDRRYWHPEIGFNYRMTNLQAAVGVAQLQKLDEILRRKAEIAATYRNSLNGIRGISLPPSLNGYTNQHWLFSVLVEPSFGVDRNELIRKLQENGIESRPLFYPIHTMPMYNRGASLPIAEELAKKGISLPSSPALSVDDIVRIAGIVRKVGKRG